VVARVEHALLFEAVALDHSARGEGGFGSTGLAWPGESDT
jgi:dUTPase